MLLPATLLLLIIPILPLIILDWQVTPALCSGILLMVQRCCPAKPAAALWCKERAS